MIKKDIKSFVLSAGEYPDMQCSIPVTLYSALIENGHMDSPFEQIGAKLVARKIPDSCTFVSKIEFSEAEASAKHVYLRIGKILARCEILFNGRSYGMISNANASAIFDITDKARAGENVLEIRCAESAERKNYVIRSGEIFGGYVTAPKLADIGMLEAPELIISDGAVITAVKTEQRFDDGRVNLFVRTDMLGDSDDVRVVASLVSPSGKIYFGGACEGGAVISVPDPELWWPNGYGAARLYKLSVTAYRGADPEDTYERRIGLRRVEFVNDEGGTPRLHVNGVEIYPRGASYVAPKPVLSDVARSDMEALVKRAVEMNFNTLSVFDEGVVPPECFYELCDKHGIMVWQSLSVPYVAPPAAGVFASGLYDAIDRTVAMLSEHPSVAVAFLAVTESKLGMSRLFHDAVEEFMGVCLKIIAPIVSGITNILFESDMEKMLSYDERYLSVSNNDALYTCSLPTEETLREFLPPEEYNLFSAAAEARTVSRGACLDMMDSTFAEMRFPCGMSELVYSTQAAAAYAAGEGVRRARAMNGLSRSAIFRQFNDSEYFISPAILDYCLRKKSVCYKLAEAFEPTIVSIEACEKKIKVYIRNDLKKEYEGKLLIALYDTKNRCWYENTRSVNIPAATSMQVGEEDLSKYIDDPCSYYLIYELFTETMVADSGTVRFVPLKHFKFRDPQIKSEITGMCRSFTLKLTSSSYVAGAEISFDGVTADFSDNLVDIVQMNPTVINFTVDSAISPEELASKLRIRTPLS